MSNSLSKTVIQRNSFMSLTKTILKKRILKRKLLSMCWGLMVCALTNAFGQDATVNQRVWYAKFQLFTHFTSGSVPERVNCVTVDNNGLTIAGLVDTAYIYSRHSNSYQDTVHNLHSLIRQTSPINWVNPGNVNSGTNNPVYWYANMYGNEYVSAYNLHGNMLYKRNSTTNNYDSVPGLTCDEFPNQIHEWGNNKALLVFNEATSAIQNLNGAQYRNYAIVDLTTNALSHTSADTVFFSGVTRKLQMWNDTLFAVCQPIDQTEPIRFWGLKKSTTTWMQNVIPSLFGNRVYNFTITANGIYVVIGQDATQVYELWRYRSSWEKLATMMPTNYTLNNQQNSPYIFRGLLQRNNTIYLGGEFNAINGQSLTSYVAFDETTNTAKRIGTYTTADASECRGYFWYDGALHVVVQGIPWGFVDPSYYTVYVLYDTTAQIPHIIGPTGPQSSTFTLTGTAAPNQRVVVYQTGTNVQRLTTANASGAWSLTLSGYLPGIYSFYPAGLNSSGYESDTGATKDVTVVTATSVETLVAEDNGVSVYPNPTTGKVNLTHTKQVQVYTLNGLELKNVSSEYTSTGGMQVNISALPNGVYIFNCHTAMGKEVRIKIVKQ